MLAIQNYLIGKELRSGKYYSEFGYLYDLVWIEDFDFTLVSNSLDEVRDIKGKKLSQKYALEGNENIIIAEKIFTDILDEDGKLKKIKIDFVWYEWASYDSETESYLPLVSGHAKSKTIKINTGKRARILKNRREYSLDRVRQFAEGTENETNVHKLLLHYKTLKDIYIEDGSDDLKNAILFDLSPEGNAEIQAILLTDITIEEMGVTAKIYELILMIIS